MVSRKRDSPNKEEEQGYRGRGGTGPVQRKCTVDIPKSIWKRRKVVFKEEGYMGIYAVGSKGCKIVSLRQSGGVGGGGVVKEAKDMRQDN